VKAEQESMIRTVMIGEETFHTLDNYEIDFSWDQEVVEDEEMWKD
jgi:hypothetical protein